MRYIACYVSTLIVFVGIDFVWLSLMNARLYRPTLDDILLEQPAFSAAVAFYLTYVAGLVIFVGAPALRAANWTHAALFGALYGLFCYATYDLTNQATLRNWSIMLTMTDLAWGMILSAVAAVAGYVTTTKFIAR